ncbi:asparagine synthase-related protein [Sphingomonas sp. LY29]|uniref:asparagine synthase-related protein n=1 Tax=Sphingomonas sp. LY29 TaxID=3095341 RepID=UPI002D786F6C|nr:asparagine synthase-related protein [Sphingomonas sp. LY29]WRP26240.1 asparagine synthase-related protein [Sphingomonas sp. LY29]
MKRCDGVGASVLFTGQVGNFTVSMGGSKALGDLLTQDGAAAWWRAATTIGGRSASSWRSVASVSFGPFLPAALYKAAVRVTGRGLDFDASMPMLKGAFRVSAERQRHRRTRDWRPERSYRDDVAHILTMMEPISTSPLVHQGVEVRDPTGDRRLAERCLAIPAAHFVPIGTARPVYEAAFGARIPDAVRHSPIRGFQGADWNEVIDPREVGAAFDRVGRNSIVREMIDRRAIDELLNRWPRTGGGRSDVYDLYVNKLLSTLSVAMFVNTHFPD